jgi:hypothetical protein
MIKCAVAFDLQGPCHGASRDTFKVDRPFPSPVLRKPFSVAIGKPALYSLTRSHRHRKCICQDLTLTTALGGIGFLGIGFRFKIFKRPFLWPSHIVRPAEMSIPLLLSEKPAVVPLRLGRRAVGRCARGALWRRSLELRASGAVGLRWQAVFGLLRSSRIVDSTRWRTRWAAGRQAQMTEDFDNHRRIIKPVEGAAIIFKAPPQLGQCSTVSHETRITTEAAKESQRKIF